MAEYTAIKDCYYSDGNHKHRYFKMGQKLPEGWLHDANGCTHFALTKDAKKIIKTGQQPTRALTSGDDKRSTDVIRAALGKCMKTVPQSWKRKKLWAELIKRESAANKDAGTKEKK